MGADEVHGPADVRADQVHRALGGQLAALDVAVDGQPDASITRKRFWEGNFLWNPDPKLGGSGFKAFRPFVWTDVASASVSDSELIDLGLRSKASADEDSTDSETGGEEELPGTCLRWITESLWACHTKFHKVSISEN